MSKLRVTIEIDTDNPHVRGRQLERLSNAAQVLHYACESENYPNVWGNPSSEGWETRDIVTRDGGRGHVIGSFKIERGVQ